jgi:hypothetical protein
MAQTPGRLGAVQQHGTFGIRHNATAAEFAEPVSHVWLIEASTRLALLQDGQCLIYRVHPSHAQVSAKEALDPGTLFARIRYETDADLGNGEWQGVVHHTRAIARLYSTIKQDIALCAPEILDLSLRDSRPSGSVWPGSNLWEDDPPQVSAQLIFLRESLSHLLVEPVKDTGQIGTTFPCIQIQRLRQRLSIAGEKVIGGKQLTRRQRAGGSG